MLATDTVSSLPPHARLLILTHFVVAESIDSMSRASACPHGYGRPFSACPSNASIVEDHVVAELAVLPLRCFQN